MKALIIDFTFNSQLTFPRKAAVNYKRKLAMTALVHADSVYRARLWTDQR